MKYLFLISLLLLVASCAKKSEEVKTKIEGENLEKQMIQAYNEGLKAFNKGDIFLAKILINNHFVKNRFKMFIFFKYFNQNLKYYIS